MSQSIFRQSSMDRISSPEQMRDYIRVTSPSVWLVLSAVVLLLVGACVWGVFGRIDTKLETTAVVENGTAVCYLSGEDAETVQAGMPLELNGEQTEVAQVSGPLERDGILVFQVTASTSASDGVYSAQIVVESIAPMSFVLN